MNEGCINCGRVEDYNGGDDPTIRYLCSVCVCCGLAKQEEVLRIYEEVETAIKAAKRPRIRISKKREKRLNKTIADC